MATFSIYAMGIGNGWELIAFPIVNAISVCAVGLIFQRFTSVAKQLFSRLFIGTLIVSALGSAILLIPRAWGFVGVLLPIIGAIIGYHIANRS